MVPPMIRDMWADDLPAALAAASDRWPELTDLEERVRSIDVEDPYAPTLLHKIKRWVEEKVDPELIFRSPGSPDFDENLMALDAVLQLFKTKASGQRH